MKRKVLLFASFVILVTVLSSCGTKKCPAYSQINTAQVVKTV